MDSHASGEKNARAKKDTPPKEYVPLYTRIKRLRRQAELSIRFWTIAPCLPFPIAQGLYYFGYKPHPGILLQWSIIFGLTGVFIFVVSMLAKQLTRQAYLLTSSYLYQTNLPMLMADEQIIEIFQPQETTAIARIWLGFVQPKSTIHQLEVAASHSSMLRETLVGNESQTPKTVMDSSCLWISGTRAGQGLVGAATGLVEISTISGFCGLGCLGLFLPVLSYYMHTLFYRQAALMAVCDYFLGTPQVEMHKLNNVGRFFVASAATEGNPEEVGLLPQDA